MIKLDKDETCVILPDSDNPILADFLTAMVELSIPVTFSWREEMEDSDFYPIVDDCTTVIIVEKCIESEKLPGKRIVSLGYDDLTSKVKELFNTEDGFEVIGN